MEVIFEVSHLHRTVRVTGFCPGLGHPNSYFQIHLAEGDEEQIEAAKELIRQHFLQAVNGVVDRGFVIGPYSSTYAPSQYPSLTGRPHYAEHLRPYKEWRWVDYPPEFAAKEITGQRPSPPSDVTPEALAAWDEYDQQA